MNILGLRESVAYAIFDVFFAISGGCIQGTPAYTGSERTSVAQLRQESNRSLLQKMGGVVDQANWPAASTARQVSLPGLLIFLLCQLFVERRNTATGGGITSEAIAYYVRQHLHDFITSVAVTCASRLTIADASELGYLLREVVNGVEQPFGPSVSFLWQYNEKTIDVAVLSQFLRTRIRSNADAKKLTHQNANAANAFGFNNVQMQNLVDTVQITSYSVLPEAASKLLSSNLTISDCSQTHLYAPSSLPSTRLSSLANCTVCLGPIGGVLAIDNCHHTVISALCGSIVVSNCTNVVVYVCVNTPPVLVVSEESRVPGSLGNSAGVRFAPYNSFYPAIEQHIATSGLNPLLNLWNVGLPDQDFILPPSDFQSMPFPLTQSSTLSNVSRTNPCPLPTPYHDALGRRQQRLKDVNKSISDAATRLREAGRQDLVDMLHQRIGTMFRSWLKQNGQEHVIVELAHASTPSKASTRLP